jgi:hypothetical protein
MNDRGIGRPIACDNQQVNCYTGANSFRGALPAAFDVFL